MKGRGKEGGLGKKNLILWYSSKKVSALGGWLNQIHLAEESCISRNGLALGAPVCSVIAGSSPWEAWETLWQIQKGSSWSRLSISSSEEQFWARYFQG